MLLLKWQQMAGHGALGKPCDQDYMFDNKGHFVQQKVSAHQVSYSDCCVYVYIHVT